MSATPNKIVVRDALGGKLSLEAPAKRIVSLVPSVTETLIDLGAGGRLVGITNYCVHPASVVTGIPKVGGTKGFSLEKIDALDPDLIIANKEENRRHQIDALRERYDVFVTYPRTIRDAVEMIRDLGVITDTSRRAGEFAVSYDHLIDSIVRTPLGRSLRTACMIWRDPWMAAGPDSYMSDLLEHFGFENVFARDEGRYPETNLETLLAHHPQIIILPDEPYAFGETDKREIESLLRSRGHDARILLMNGSYLTWFGTRTLRALRHLHETRLKLTPADH